VSKQKDNITRSALDAYFSNIDNTSLLTQEQEIELSQIIQSCKFKIRSNQKIIASNSLTKKEVEELKSLIKEETKKCETARNMLFETNLRLVISIVKIYVRRSPNLTLLDLIHEGNIALWKAADRFDWMMNCKFSTYATPAIHRAIWRHLPKKSRTSLISEAMIAFIKDKREPSPVTKYENSNKRELLKEAIKRIPKKRDRQVIIMKYLFHYNTKEIAHRLKVSRLRVRQYEERGLRNLRKNEKLLALIR